jgi:hypothetical protein
VTNVDLLRTDERILYENQQNEINNMKTITINIAKQSVSVNGQVCNFIEAGLHNNETPATVLTDRAEIEEVLNDQYEGQEIEVVFE